MKILYIWYIICQYLSMISDWFDMNINTHLTQWVFMFLILNSYLFDWMFSWEWWSAKLFLNMCFDFLFCCLEISLASMSLPHSILVVILIPVNHAHETIFLCFVITLLTTEPSMRSKRLLCCEEMGITRCIAAVVYEVGSFLGVYTLSNGCMRCFIAYLCWDAIIEGIEVTKPISIIVFVDIFDHTSLEWVEFTESFLGHQNGELFTSNPSSTIKYYFFLPEFIFVFFKQFWDFAKIEGSCWNSILKVPKIIFIIIAHIENNIVIGFFAIEKCFESFWWYFFMKFEYFLCCDLRSECDNLIANFHTHSRKLVIIDRSCFSINILDIAKIVRIFKIMPIWPELPSISCYGWADTFCSNIDTSLESKIATKTKMFECNIHNFIFWNIDEFIESKEWKFWLMFCSEWIGHRTK